MSTMPLLDQPEVLLTTAAVTLIAMLLLWLTSLTRRDASIVDPYWGPGFVLVTVTALLIGAAFEPRGTLMTIMVGVWGLRLGLHLLVRNFHEGEDRRYRSMRDHWGSSFWWVSLFTVFLLQGSLMWIISLPIQAVVTGTGPEGWTLVDVLGILVFITGFLFEAVGDWQLQRFKADPATAGKVLDRGLWRYTRHPNYFGNALIWWGIFIVATSTPGGRLLIFSPILMTFLLLKVSGVVLLESDITERRPAYRNYIEQTSAFFPWLPKTLATSPETESMP